MYYAASTHLVKDEKERKLDEAAELIEQVNNNYEHSIKNFRTMCVNCLSLSQELHLLGATAIEDKLQKVCQGKCTQLCVYFICVLHEHAVPWCVLYIGCARDHSYSA